MEVSPQTPNCPFTVGSLSPCLATWEEMTGNSFILRLIEVGFRLPWSVSRPPLLASPPSPRPLSTPGAAEVLQEEVEALLLKGAVEVVSPPVSPGFYGRLFCVPKASGGWRPVLDLSALNRFLRSVHFRMETPLSIREAVQEGDWAASIDLSDAYFHLMVHERDRKYLRFQWGGRTFQFRCLPFGLSLAPWIFTRLVREYLLSLRSLGIRIRAYLDDWLVLAESRELCQAHVSKAMDLALSLGFRPNFKKSELSPSQRFTFLGMDFNSVDMTVAPSADRLGRLSRSLALLASRESASARSLASLLGQMESLAPLLPLGRLWKRPFQRALRDRFNLASRDWDAQIPLVGWFLRLTAQWRNQGWLASRVPIHAPKEDVTLFTDASGEEGWGGHLDLLPLQAEGRWSHHDHVRLSHINLKEMEGVRLCLLRFLPVLAGKVVRLFTDNSSVSTYVNRQGGIRSDGLSMAAEFLLRWCDKHGIRLFARHLSGKLNVLADMLSRPDAVLQTEWTLCHRVLERVWVRFHRPHLDLFATRFSKRLPLYVSPVPDGEAWADDALSLDWAGLQAYAFPPLPILHRVIQKARRDKPCLLLVAPLWRAQPWFPELLQISRGDPFPLRLRRGDLVQPRTGVPHGNVDVLDLHVFQICEIHSVH